jgi:ATP-dependent Clp protease, protease subunit
VSKTTFQVFNYKVENSSENAVDVYIDSDIVDATTQEIYKNYFGDDSPTSYKSFRDQLNIDNLKTVNIFINSPGGMVTEAMAIHDLIVEMQSKGITVNTKGRGIIASAATYILMAGNSDMSENSWFMIHNVAGFAYGNVNEVENQARTLRKFNDQITKFYSNATGLSETVIGNMMDKETWLSATEAKDKGFVKNVSGKVNFTNSINPEQWQFSNMAVLNSYNSFTNKNNPDMDISKVTEAIENAFKKFFPSNAATTVSDADGKAFAEAVVNGIKDQLPTNETIQEMVNAAVNAAVANIKLPEAPALPENLVTTDVLNNAVTKATENVVTKTDLEETKNSIINAVGDKIGNRSTETKKNVVTLPGNRFVGQDFQKQ